jgi:hypothetical protein
MMDREQAAEIFLDRLIFEGYRLVVAATLRHLAKGPQGSEPAEDDLLDHQWYMDLSEEEKQRVRRIVQETASVCLQTICGILDGITGDALNEHHSDFALYLQVYPSEDARLAGEPVTWHIRINPDAGGDGDMLHEILWVKIHNAELLD